jgi:hypothetical protein
VRVAILSLNGKITVPAGSFCIEGRGYALQFREVHRRARIELSSSSSPRRVRSHMTQCFFWLPVLK